MILHLYEEHGEDCARHLRGMFAFAIWDARSNTLLLGKDHMGQKPLFFYQDGQRFLFASEIQALLASGAVPRTLDANSLWHYLSLRSMPDECSMIAGVRKLPAAHTLLRTTDGRIRTRRYWTPDFGHKLMLREHEAEEALDECLRETVHAHLLSDVPVGTFLSGGIDSTTIGAIMARQLEAQVPAFSIGVYLVSRLAARHVKVALSGDGGDESFAGYDRYVGQRLVDYYCMLPAVLRRRVMPRLIAAVPETFGYKSLAQRLAWLQEMSEVRGGERHARTLGVLRFTPEERAELFHPAVAQSLADPDTLAKVLRYFDAPNVEDLTDRMLYTDLMTRVVHAAKGLDESSAGPGRRAAHGERVLARQCRTVRKEADQELRRRHDTVGPKAVRLDTVRKCCPAALPAVPVLSFAVHHVHRRVLAQQLDAARQAPRQVHVIGIEEGNQLPARCGDTEVARGAHAPVLVVRVLEITYPAGVVRRVSSGDPGARVRRAVVDEQQFPMAIRLREYARDGLVEKRFRVQEAHHHGHEFAAARPALAGIRRPPRHTGYRSTSSA